jgi:hypothetical protein
MLHQADSDRVDTADADTFRARRAFIEGLFLCLARR